VASVIRLLLIDDHPVVLGGLREALREVDDVVIVGAATSLAEGRRLLAAVAPEVVLVDVRLPDGSGLDLINERQDDGPAWVVLSSFDSPAYLAAALELGAAGFLLKTSPIGEVVDAIRRAAKGGTSFETKQLELAREVRRLRLTPRERQVIGRLLVGRSNDEIGHDLGLARKTVEAHLSRLYERFGVASRTELALRMERDGWVVEGDALNPFPSTRIEI
jgi:two-component system response regulator DevR